MNEYKITTLPNGTRIISEYIPYVKSFSLGFWFNVGARDENVSNNGISHFIEHMLFKGTKRRSAKRIAEEIESYGGYLNAFTSKEHTCYYTKGLSENLAKSFTILADMIQNPLFKESHVRRESGVIIDELHDVNDNPEELIFDMFEEVIFKGNRLSMPVIGTEGNIRKFKADELHKFHQKKYDGGRPENKRDSGEHPPEDQAEHRSVDPGLFQAGQAVHRNGEPQPFQAGGDAGKFP